MQKKVDSLRKKGASIEFQFPDEFLELVRPTAEEIVALMKDGQRGLKELASAAPPFFDRDAPKCAAVSAVNFDGLDLSNADLKGIAFTKCSFVGAKLEGAD